MGCFAPLKAYYGAEVNPATGKRKLVFKRELSFSGIPVRLPCQQCSGCRLEKSRQWAMRCIHEKKLHKASSFITLTYDTEQLPEGGTLVKRDFQLFMKRMRKLRPSGKPNPTCPEEYGLRFYMCGEYGERNGRPHYHALFLNTDFPDKVPFSKNRRGDVYYRSDELRCTWTHGHVLVGEVNFDTSAYVARYCMSKVTGDLADSHYEVYDRDGVVHRRLSEYTDMSRKPGLGSGYYSRFGSEVRAHDSVIVNGREVRPPRFYDTKFELIDPEGFAITKKKRVKMAFLLRADNTTQRRRVKETLLLRRLKDKERGL
jgi:hypothetical protein